MNYTCLDDILTLGDFGARTALLAGRLTDAMYRPDAIFTMDKNGWSGDWEGRAMLAQTLISRLTGCESPFLRANFQALKPRLNERGYLGGIMPEGLFDEQQFSGHGWLLRAMCEYYLYTGDASALEVACTIAKNLFLPARGSIGKYPYKPGERQEGGAFAGNISGVVGCFRISTDTGCVFISMDGLGQLYEITKDPALLELLNEMYDMFVQIDVAECKMQTHATLSAARGILRLYDITGAEKFLITAKRIFDVYLNRGMTATYANMNWFGRPEWTEPCAIIDSMGLAMELFRHTRDVKYADMARLIWHNGVCASQRPNGGFGCDSCAGPGEDYLRVRTYEAYWCCTMRGAEGVAWAARFLYLRDGDRVILPMFASSVAEFDIAGGRVRLRQTAEADSVTIYAEKNTARRAVTVQFLMPEWSGAGERYISRTLPSEGGEISIKYETPEYRLGRRRMRGDYILGQSGDAKPVPIAGRYLRSDEGNIRVLFD